MNYITINGVKSNTVKGLLIQSLPPITKPKIRTSIEEIDGRDGDIVTKLGYSAYDKEIKIGLHGDFDIDDCIKFFDTSGKVVFSNEPDKYYNFAILDQIDFNRLIRFREATVKFHVQPFKFSDVEDEIDFFKEFISIHNFSGLTNGISCNASGTITLNGTAKQPTELYIPITPINLESGNYTLSVKSVGNVEGSSIRLIAGSPSNSKSFGGNYLSLADNNTVSKTSNDGGSLTYNYIWLYIPQSTVLNATVSVSLVSNSVNSVNVFNSGNTFSRPKITLYGSGKVELYVNSFLKLTVNIDEDYIVIDNAEMNAYHESTLKNRQVVGDYSKFILDIGNNVISWNGNVTDIKIENFSRWI